MGARVVAAFDLGSTTGWAVLDLDGRRLASGQWRLAVVRCHRAPSPGARYLALRQHTLDLLDRWDGQIEFVAVELPMARTQSTQARRLGYGFLATVEVLCVRREIDVVEVVNTKTKMALGGHGRSSKAEQIGAARRRFGIEAGEHEADALGVGLAGLELWRSA